MWVVRQWNPGYAGWLLFAPALAAVGVAANLRLHLWFTSCFYPAELAAHRRRVFRWVRVADSVLAATVGAAAASIHGSHATTATLLAIAAVGCVVAFVLIEPTTAHAAFGNDS